MPLKLRNIQRPTVYVILGHCITNSLADRHFITHTGSTCKWVISMNSLWNVEHIQSLKDWVEPEEIHVFTQGKGVFHLVTCHHQRSRLNMSKRLKDSILCEHVCLSHVSQAFGMSGVFTVTGAISAGFIWVTHAVFIWPCTPAGANLNALRHVSFMK